MGHRELTATSRAESTRGSTPTTNSSPLINRRSGIRKFMEGIRSRIARFPPTFLKGITRMGGNASITISASIEIARKKTEYAKGKKKAEAAMTTASVMLVWPADLKLFGLSPPVASPELKWALSARLIMTASLAISAGKLKAAQIIDALRSTMQKMGKRCFGITQSIRGRVRRPCCSMGSTASPDSLSRRTRGLESAVASAMCSSRPKEESI